MVSIVPDVPIVRWRLVRCIKLLRAAATPGRLGNWNTSMRLVHHEAHEGHEGVRIYVEIAILVLFVSSFENTETDGAAVR